jgi:6-phosphogluconolactonase (cycloisomerase 2 family)
VAGTTPYYVTLDPSGRFAYVANSNSKSVSAYEIDAASGVLSAVSGSPFAAGTAPLRVTVSK